MKFSRYIQFIKHEDFDKEILFAYRQIEALVLDKTLAEGIKTNINTPDNLNKIHSELYDELVKKQIIIPTECDETALCLSEIAKKLSSDETIRLTINPTMDCNLRCWYCYEKHEIGSEMNASMIYQVCDYIERITKSNSMKHLILSFFGGEPLLKYYKVIRPIIVSACEACNKNRKSIMVNFTSNGVCLSKTITDDLSKIINNISIQVAFDGGKSQHDNIKKFRNGNGTYNTVLYNLKYAIQKGFFVTIRCNYTAQNLLSFIELVNDFSDFHNYKNLKFSFHRVWQEEDSDVLTSKMLEFKSIMRNYKISSNLNSYAVVNISPCYADYSNSLVINYNGDVYKCTARNFNKENKIGRLHNGTIIFDEHQIYNSIPRLYYQDCKECRLLPICNICYQLRKENSIECPQQKISGLNIIANIEKYYHNLITAYN